MMLEKLVKKDLTYNLLLNFILQLSSFGFRNQIRTTILGQLFLSVLKLVNFLLKNRKFVYVDNLNVQNSGVVT